MYCNYAVGDGMLYFIRYKRDNLSGIHGLKDRQTQRQTINMLMLVGYKSQIWEKSWVNSSKVIFTSGICHCMTQETGQDGPRVCQR